MKLVHYKIYLILLLVLLSIFFLFSGKEVTKNVLIGNKTIIVEVADTPAKRTEGLMFRDFLGENEGMLFVFDNEDYYSFWMLNTKIPLDIIWINKNKEIIDIERNLQPCPSNCPLYSPDEKALYVLEVNANYTFENDIKVGDEVEL
jgi:uncharacterized membrane protein (UPF0127 family)